MSGNDDKLISEYLEGDEQALGVLIDGYLPDLYNFAFKLTRDLQAAEDITQESFIKAWKNIRRYRQGNNFRAWLFRIARNTAIDWLRKKRDLAFSDFENKEGENTLVATLADRAPLPDELLAKAEDAEYLEGILERMSPQYREVLALRYSSNLTFAEIGAILKKPLHTVKSQHRRALIALKRVIQAEPV